jgi:hypothetical protein
MLIPSKGKLLKKRGRMAQWMAHAIDVTIPIASQFIFILFIQVFIIAKIF